MVTPSQRFKNEIYPSDFTDDDKLLYDDLLVQSKLHHPEIAKSDEWILKMAIKAYIRQETGKMKVLSDDEVEELKEKYKLKNSCFETHLDAEFYDKLIASQNTSNVNITDNALTSNI